MAVGGDQIVQTITALPWGIILPSPIHLESDR